MNNTILIDFNFFLHRSVYEIERADERINKKNLKIRLLDNLLSLRKEFKNNYKETIIAIDSSSWRKTLSPYYKFKRKENRKKDNKDWEQIHKDFSEIVEEFKQNLPYKFLQVKGCEGDDIIAVLSNYLTSKVLIISVDKDFEQLQRKHNINQWNPTKQSYYNYNKDEIVYNLFAHILRGEGSSGDGVPNILNPLDCFYKGVRQKPLKETYIKEAFNNALKNNLKDFLGEELYKRFLENKTLIDFRCIPEDTSNNIINNYKNYILPSVNIYNYLLNNELEMFINDIMYF